MTQLPKMHKLFPTTLTVNKTLLLITCGEASPLVTLGELNVEVRNEGMHIVIPTHLKHTHKM